MVVTKIENFTKSQNQLATVAKALGHPARIAILEHLLKIDRCICGDFVEELPLSQATVSQHLRALKDAGLIKGNIEVTSDCYCNNQQHWNQAQKVLNQLFDSYKGTDCC